MRWRTKWVTANAGEVRKRESTRLLRCVSHEAEKQFSQTKGYRQGGISSVINANDVTTFFSVCMGRDWGEETNLLSGSQLSPGTHSRH
jgi:hypothetical protein